MTEWRKENVPAASTKLWHSWFEPLPCHQRTPNLSIPPSPPSDVPEPVSHFGHFIAHLSVDRREKRISNMGHYSPRLSRSSLTSVKSSRPYFPGLSDSKGLGSIQPCATAASSLQRPSSTPGSLTPGRQTPSSLTPGWQTPEWQTSGLLAPSRHRESRLPKITASTVNALAGQIIAVT